MNGAYEKHCRAAATIAREMFSYDVVLSKMLDDLGAGRGSCDEKQTAAREGNQSIKASPGKSNGGVGSASPSRNFHLPIQQNEEDGFVVLASCLGDDNTGGGLFSFDGATLVELDRLSSTGLCATGERVFRALRSSTELPSIGELIVYDAIGVERYHRIDALAD